MSTREKGSIEQRRVEGLKLARVGGGKGQGSGRRSLHVLFIFVYYLCLFIEFALGVAGDVARGAGEEGDSKWVCGFPLRLALNMCIFVLLIVAANHSHSSRPLLTLCLSFSYLKFPQHSFSLLFCMSNGPPDPRVH